MQFVIIAKDGSDTEVLQRRLHVREEHIQNIEENRRHMIMGAATLNESKEMNGSVMIVDFPSSEDLDNWLKSEPYVTAKVWQDITILPCQIGPSFIK